MPVNPCGFWEILFQIEKKHMQELDGCKEQKIHDPVIHIYLFRIIHEVNAFWVIFVLADQLAINTFPLFSDADFV